MPYRNQDTTMQKIQMIAGLRINTMQEAVAFLRCLSAIHNQIAGVIQREALKKVQELNRAAQPPITEPEPQPVAVSNPIEADTLVPEDLSDKVEYTESEVEARVAALKAASKPKETEDKPEETEDKPEETEDKPKETEAKPKETKPKAKAKATKAKTTKEKK